MNIRKTVQGWQGFFLVDSYERGFIRRFRVANSNSARSQDTVSGEIIVQAAGQQDAGRRPTFFPRKAAQIERKNRSRAGPGAESASGPRITTCWAS